MPFAFESFVFVPDLSRIATFREQKDYIRSRMPWLLSAELLYHFYRTPLFKGTGYAVNLFSEVVPTDFQRRYYACFQVKNRPPTREDWLVSLNEEPDRALDDLFAASFNGRFVLGSALPPQFKKTLNTLGIPWIDIKLHAVRYLDNLLHSFSTNVPEIDALLERESLAPHYFEAAAAHETARYAINNHHCNFWLPRPTALITNYSDDLPAFDTNGKEFFFTSAAARLRAICDECQRVFCVAPLNKDEKTFLDSLGVIRLPDPRYKYFRNHYMLLAHPAVSLVIGRTEEDILEARFFGKKCEYPAHFPPALEPARPIYETSFSGAFWHRVVASFAKPKNAAPSDAESWPVPKLRLALRGKSDFDDSVSFHQAAQIGEIKRHVKELQRACSVRHMFEDLWPQFGKENSLAAPSRHPRDIAGAVFCAGDDNVTAFATVALCSFRKKGVCADLFYITDTDALSDRNRRLLTDFNITPLHTRYADNFNIRYLHTTPSAYNQFAGPGLLAARGRPYSIGIQADVLCIRHFDPRTVFLKTRIFAATHNNVQEKRAGTYADPEEVIAKYDFCGDIFDTMRLNPGVIFFNNRNYVDNDVESKFIDIYKNIDEDKILLGEETVLNILLSQHPSWLTILEPEYNCLVLHSFGRVIPYCLHFAWINDKPWHILDDQKMLQSPTANYCKKIWHNAAKDILGAALYKTYITPKLFKENAE